MSTPALHSYQAECFFNIFFQLISGLQQVFIPLIMLLFQLTCKYPYFFNLIIFIKFVTLSFFVIFPISKFISVYLHIQKYISSRNQVSLGTGYVFIPLLYFFLALSKFKHWFISNYFQFNNTIHKQKKDLLMDSPISTILPELFKLNFKTSIQNRNRTIWRVWKALNTRK